MAPGFQRGPGPGVPVHGHRVGEELGVPDGRQRRPVGRQVVERRAPVEEGPRVGVEQRPVGLERAVLDGEGEVLGARRQPTPGPDVVGAALHDEQPGEPGVHVQPREPQRVVVVPEQRGPLVVVVVEHGRAGHGARAVELVEARAPPGVARRDVERVGKHPRLGVPVAVGRGVGTVDVGDERDRSTVGARRRRERRAGVGRPRRVGPVQAGIHREEVGDEPAGRVHELVAPAHPDRDIGRGHDGGGRRGERHGVVGRPVGPDRSAGQPGWEHLLRDGTRPDVVQVDPGDRDGPTGHHRWLHQVGHVLGDGPRVEAGVAPW